MFCYAKNGNGYKACAAIMAALAPITPGESDSITVNNLYEVRCAAAPTAYIEVGFHDNQAEAQWIIDHVEDIAEAICRGVCHYYDVKYLPADQQVSAPAMEITECDIKLPVLKKGDNGKSVRALQSLLIGCGYLCGVWGADGDFGAATDETLRKFQKNVGIVSDGIAGADTWSKLLKG